MPRAPEQRKVGNIDLDMFHCICNPTRQYTYHFYFIFLFSCLTFYNLAVFKLKKLSAEFIFKFVNLIYYFLLHSEDVNIVFKKSQVLKLTYL